MCWSRSRSYVHLSSHEVNWCLFFKFLCHLTSHPEIQPVFRCLRVNLVYIDIHIYIYIYKTIIYDQRDCKEVLQLALSDSLMHKCELWVLNFKEKRDVKNQSQIENSSFSLLSFFPTKKIPRYCFHPQSCISSPPIPPRTKENIIYAQIWREYAKAIAGTDCCFQLWAPKSSSNSFDRYTFWSSNSNYSFSYSWVSDEEDINFYVSYLFLVVTGKQRLWKVRNTCCAKKSS